MTARTFQWNPLAQARRIMAVDARQTAIDMVFGLAYVLAGFYIFPDAKNLVHIVAAPFGILSGVILYLAARVCEPEGSESTAMFYASLPRSRRLAFWTHAAWLTAFTLAMEVVIGLGAVWRLNAGHPGQHFTITPFLVGLPFFAIACGLFKTYYHHFVTLRVFVDILVVIVCAIIFIVFLIPMEYFLWNGIGKYRLITGWDYFGPGVTLALMTLFLIGYVYQRWINIQMGESQ